jgi:hypothetical protein
MDAYAQVRAATQAGYIRQALVVEGGHLFIGPNGAILHFAPGARVSGFPCEAIKAACLAAGLPVIDSRAVPFRRLYAVVVEGPMTAVGKPPDPQPWHSLSDAPLAYVAGLNHAAGADVFNVLGIPGTGAGAAS